MNPVLTVLAFVVFASSMFSRAIDPIVPQIADGLGTDAATAALLSTAYALPLAIVQPVLGALADMFNKTRLILICLAIVAAATIAGALVTSFPLMVASRVLTGIGAGGLVPIAFAVLGDLVPVKDRQVAMGRLLFAIMSGNLLGATASGAIGDLFGWRAVFIVMAVVGCGVLVLGVISLRGVGQRGGGFSLSAMQSGYRSIFANRLAKFCFGAVFVEGALMYGVFPHLAALFHDMGETRASIPGIVIGGFAIGGVIYSLRVGFLLRIFGENWMMRIGGLLMGLTIAFIALRAPWQADVVDFAVLGLAFYMLHGVIQIYASELAPAARGSAMALHSFFYFLGQAAGPAIYAVGFGSIGVTPTLMVSGVMLVINGAVAGHFLRRSAQSAT
ncbi:MFS transporter [Pseudolabrys sp. FHR47]|uniref:MFS transporter n=1 Tax=Pseudolabrys sp. FHR47 TaxID=2562284 RepID=UPI0010BF358E|nr:MFS transporter [Pseudolabrys sp. FHR47]